MARNPAAQTAFGPIVLAAIEHNESPERRLVDDDLALSFLPAPLRSFVRATRWAMLRCAGRSAHSHHRRAWVPMDFECDDLMTVLREHGYRPDYRTFFIWEGVTQYLTPDAVRDTLDQLSHAAPASRLVFTYVCQDFIDGRNMYDAPYLYRRMRQRSQIWKSSLEPDGVEEFLDGYGWRTVEEAGPEYYLDHYVRPARRTLPVSALERTVYAEKS